MAANELKQLAVGNIPQHLVDWKGLREWQSGVHKTKNKDGASEATPGLVLMPSIGEFERLLYQVSPQLKNKVHFNETDLILLNISTDSTIVFYDAPRKSTIKNVSSAEQNKDGKSETEEKNKPEKSTSNDIKLIIPKVVAKSTEDNGNSSAQPFTNTVSMSLENQFNCLLIGAGCCCFAIGTSSNNNKSNNQEQVVLDLIFNNILKYVSKMNSKEEIDSCKDEIKSLWSLIFKLLNWKNENDLSLIIRLAMILCVSPENFSKLSFVKDFITSKTERTSKAVDENGAVVTRGQQDNKNSNEKPEQEEEDIHETLMNVKRKLDKSRIKKMIFEIGCFMDLYNLMIENNDQIVNRFLTYFYYLNENSSVLSMKHGVNGDTLLDIAKNLGDNLITYKTLSRYVQEDETFNEKFEEYAFYFNERCDALRRLGQTESSKQQFYETMMKILEKYFIYFSDKSVRSKIPGNARVSMEIVYYLLQESNESSLKQGLLSIYDEICKVKQKYTKREEKSKHEKKKEKKLENKENDIFLESTKIENKNIEFYIQFQYYFDELTQRENVNCDLKTFLAIVLIEVGIFFLLQADIADIQRQLQYSSSDHGDFLKQLLKSKTKEYIEFGLLNVAICDDFQHSLFHEIVTLDASETLSMLLTLDSDLAKYENIDGSTPIDVAMKSGNWSSVQQIALAKMGQKMKDKAKTEEKRIETKRGIVNQFLKQRKKMKNDGKEKKEKKETEIEKEKKSEIDDDGKDESKGDERKDGVEFEMIEDELLEDLLNTMLNLIEKQAPLSDDMLFLCWKYEMNKMKNEPNHLKNRLWIVLKKVILNVLSDTKNKQKWIWFKQNLLSSVIWYEVVLFDSSDPVLVSAINAVGGDGASPSKSKSESKSEVKKKRGKLFCECGTQYELTVPAQVLGTNYFRCTSCSQYRHNNQRFYHCPNSSANRHPSTYLCAECGEKKRKQNVTQNTTATTTTKLNGTKREAVAATNKQQKFILYAELFGMANDKLTQEKLKLKEKVDKISSQQAWKNMVNKQLPVDAQVDSKELRQDSSELLTFPNRLAFEVKKLQRFGLKDFYDVKIYLPQLLVVANALDDKFHDTLKNEILKKDMTVLYLRGPLKRIERCQAKAETDYSNEKWPTSAKILDIIRCSLIYDNCDDLMAGLNNVLTRITKQDTVLKRVACLHKNVFLFFCLVLFCVKKHRRFIENKKEAQELADKEGRELRKFDYLYQYADIKLNVMMSYEGMSMLVEIQFLLQLMRMAKKKMHSMYEITRNFEFIHGMANITSIASNKQEQLMFLIHSCDDNSKGVETLAQFLMSYGDDIDLGLRDKNGLNVWHYVFQLDKVRMFKLLLNVTNQNEWKKYLSMQASSGRKRTCFEMAIEQGAEKIVQEYVHLSKDNRYGDIFIIDQTFAVSSCTPLQLAINNSKYKLAKILFDKSQADSLRYYLTSLIIQCVRAKEDYNADDPTSCENFAFFKKLLSLTKYINTHDVLYHVSFSGRLEYVEYLLEMNSKLPVPITADQVWGRLGKLVNYRLLRSLINTNVVGLRFADLGDDEMYFQAFNGIVSSRRGYSKSDPYNCQLYKCIQLLLDQEQVQQSIQLYDRAVKVVSGLIATAAHVCVWLIIDRCTKLRLKIDWTLPVLDGNKNLLQFGIQLGHFDTVDKLMKLGVFDLNYQCRPRINTGTVSHSFGMTAILICAESKASYDPNNVIHCGNYKIFNLLLQNENKIDLNVTDQFGRDVVALLQLAGKNDEYIDLLKDKLKANESGNESGDGGNDVEWKMDEETIDSTVTKYKIGVKLKQAVDNGDDQALKLILKHKQAQGLHNDLVNMVLGCGNSRKVTILMACISAKKVSKEQKTKCFELLIDYAGDKQGKFSIDFDTVSIPGGYNIFHQVCAYGTRRMIEWFLENSNKAQRKKYFNTLTKSHISKNSCLHVAASHNNLDTLKKLMEIRQTYQGENIVDVNLVSSQYSTPQMTAPFSVSRDILFNPNRDDNGSIRNSLILACMRADANDEEEKAKNWKFFERLFICNSDKDNRKKHLIGINWPSHVLHYCPNFDKTKHLKHFLKLNGENDGKLFDVKTMWFALARCRDYELLSAALNKKECKKLGINKNMTLDCIKKDVVYRQMIAHMYSRGGISDTEANKNKMKSFEPLIQQKEILDVLMKHPQLCTEVISRLIMYRLVKWVGYLLKELRANAKGIEFKFDVNGTHFNGLQLAAASGNIDLFNAMYEWNHYNVNEDEENSRIPLLHHVICWNYGYQKDLGLESENGKMFQVLLKDKRSNLEFEHPIYHYDLISLCKMCNKLEYIPLLKKQNTKRESGNGVVAQEELSIAQTIVEAARKSNFNTLRKLLDANKDNIDKVINLFGYNYANSYMTFTRALSECINSSEEYDGDFPLDCNNFKCFKLLLSHGAKCGDSVNIHNRDLVTLCIRKNKVEFLKYAIDECKIKLDPSRADFGHCAVYGYYDMFCMLMEQCKEHIDKYDWNDVLWKVSSSIRAFNETNQRECDNFRIFETIITKCSKYLDIGGYRDYMYAESNRTTIIGLLAHSKKLEYIDYLVEQNDKYKLNIKLSNHFKPQVMDNLLFIGCVAKNVKTVRYSLGLIDKLEEENSINWRDTFGGCCNKNNGDTLLHLIALKIAYNVSDACVKIVRLLLNSIVKHDSMDLLFVKNCFGTTFIDGLMVHGLQQRSKYLQTVTNFSRVLCDEFGIKESVIEKSIKKNEMCFQLCGMCSKSNYLQLKETLDEIVASGEPVEDYINGVTIYGGEPVNCLQMCASYTYGFDDKRQLECDNYKCFKLLLSYNDNLDKAKLVVNGKIESNQHTVSVMSQCIKENKIEFVKLLLNGYCKKYNIGFKTDVSRYDYGLFYSMNSEDRHEMIKLLLKHNVFDINYYNNNDGSILHYSCESYGGIFHKCFQMESDLIDYWNILFDHVNSSSSSRNSTPSNKSVLKIDPMIVKRRKYTIFRYLIENYSRYHFDLFKYLIEIGVSKAGWNIKDILTGSHSNYNETLLHFGAKYDSVQHVKYLSSFDFVDVNAIGGVNGDTVLNMCIASRRDYDDVTYKSGKNFEVFQLLLKQNGIDPKIKNKFGLNAYDMCQREGKPQYIEYLDQFSNVGQK